MSAFLSLTTFLRRLLGLPAAGDDAAGGDHGASRYGWAPGSPSARLDRDIDELRRRLDDVERNQGRATGEAP